MGLPVKFLIPEDMSTEKKNMLWYLEQRYPSGEWKFATNYTSQLYTKSECDIARFIFEEIFSDYTPDSYDNFELNEGIDKVLTRNMVDTCIYQVPDLL